MADFSSLKQTIQNYIKQNGNEEITGNILQDVLLAMVSTMGDSAINGLVSALQDEITARQNQDGTLQGNITAETTARQQADTALGGRIDGLQTAINGINTKLEEGYIYAGIATPSTNPGTPSGKVFYIAVSSGTYTNFSNLTVAQGINILKYNGSSWSKDVVYAIDARPKKNSQNFVTSGGVFDNIGALDVSELNATENPHTPAIYANLSAALAAIQTDYQKGGMSIKFIQGTVQSSDNKYVQYRLMSDTFNTTVANWQGVDEMLTPESHNLIESGVVYNSFKAVLKIVSAFTNKNHFYFYDSQNSKIGYYSNNNFDCIHFVVDGKYLKAGSIIKYDGLGNTNSDYPAIITTDVNGHLLRSISVIYPQNIDIEIENGEKDIYLNFRNNYPYYSYFDSIAEYFVNLEHIYLSTEIERINSIFSYNVEIITNDGYATGSGTPLKVKVYGTTVVPNSTYAIVPVSSLLGAKKFKLKTSRVSPTFNGVVLGADDDGYLIQGINSDSSVFEQSITISEGVTQIFINCLSGEDIEISVIPDYGLLINELNQKVDSISSVFKIDENPIVFPSKIYLRSDKKIPIYKNSLFTDYFGYNSNCDILLRSIIGGIRQFVNVQEPLYLGVDDIGSSAKMVVARQDKETKLIYKDITVLKKDVSALNGKTVKVLSFGDSLTEGIDWGNTPVCMLADELSDIGVTTTMIGTIARDFTKGGQTVRINYEGHGGWSYRAAVGMRGQYMHLPDSYTKHEWVEGIDGTMAEIKANNPFLYEATAQDKQNYPQWCFHIADGVNTNYQSYADDATLETYWIFDPARYFSERSISIPDIITIAFGTNEWYLNNGAEFNNGLATSCCKWMVQRFSAACPNAKIVVIPLNNFPTSLEDKWKRYAMPLCSNVIKEIDALNNSNVYICPIYAQGSRVLAFNGTTGSASNISDINDIKQITIDSNVHMLYNDDDSNDDYAESLSACVINLIE